MVRDGNGDCVSKAIGAILDCSQASPQERLCPRVMCVFREESTQPGAHAKWDRQQLAQPGALRIRAENSILWAVQTMGRRAASLRNDVREPLVLASGVGSRTIRFAPWGASDVDGAQFDGGLHLGTETHSRTLPKRIHF